MAVGTAGARLREQVLPVNVGAERTSALLLDPFKPQLIAADGEGTIRVFDYGHSVLLNQFSAVPDAASPRSVRALYRLNNLS